MIFSLFSNLGTKEGVIITVVSLLCRIPAVLLALSIHEAAHGFIASKLGDPTAKNLGRITINPLKHIDPIGTISMLLFGIGWAKPVPVNSRYFKKPKRDMALTAAAGPISNILQALIAVVLLFLGTKLFLMNDEISVFNYFGIDYGSYYGLYYLLYSVIVTGSFSMGMRILAVLLFMLFTYASLNIVLAVFNLIPIPPFDGSRIAFVLLPDKIYFGVMKYERIIMIAFLLIFFIGGRFGWFDWLFTDLINLFFKAFSWIL